MIKNILMTIEMTIGIEIITITITGDNYGKDNASNNNGCKMIIVMMTKR